MFYEKFITDFLNIEPQMLQKYIPSTNTKRQRLFCAAFTLFSYIISLHLHPILYQSANRSKGFLV